MCYPAQKAAHGDGSTPVFALDCGGTASSTEPPLYLGSLPYCNRIMNCFQLKSESRGALHNPRGGAPQQRGPLTPQHALGALIGFTTHADSPECLAPHAFAHNSSLV